MPAPATIARPAANRTSERFWVDVPFVASKAPGTGATGDLVLNGYASTWVEDRDGEYVDPTAFDASLPLYLAKNPILLWQHNHDWPLGQIRNAATDEHGLEVEGYVRKPKPGEEPWKFSAYYDIQAGIVKTFSIGGMMWRDIRAGKPVITEVELWEISCVSVPANPDSIYQAAVKAINGEHRPGLHSKAIEQMAQVLGLAQISDPELARMQPAELQERYKLLAGMYAKAGKQAPAYDDWRTVAKRVMESNGNAGTGVLVEAREVIDVTKQVYGMEPLVLDGAAGAKKGRVLSKANEGRIRKIADTANELLQQLEADNAEGSTTAAPPGRAKDPGDIIWGPENGFQDLCSDIAEQLNVPGNWRYDVVDVSVGLDYALVGDWQANEYWVVPITVDGGGEPEVGLPGTWVAAERGWVEASELAASKTRHKGQ